MTYLDRMTPHSPRGRCSRCHPTIGIQPGEPLCANCQRDDHPTIEENLA